MSLVHFQQEDEVPRWLHEAWDGAALATARAAVALYEASGQARQAEEAGAYLRELERVAAR